MDARLHAINGPMPVSSNSVSPSGILTELKNGGPTVIFSPLTASVMIGKIDPDKHDVVIKKCSLAAHHALESRFRFEILETRRDEIRRDNDRNQQEAGEP